MKSKSEQKQRNLIVLLNQIMISRRSHRRSPRDDDPKYGEKGRMGWPKRSVLFLILLTLIVLFQFMLLLQGNGLQGSTSETNEQPEQWPPVQRGRPQGEEEQQQQQQQQQQQGGRTNLRTDLPPPSSNLVTHLEDGSPIGYVRVPRIPSDGVPTSDDGRLHIIFSSGCNYFQHWQSEFLLASAFLVGQRGRITRIVSGCHDKTAETIAHKHQTFPSGKNDLLVPMEYLNRSVNENFGLFVTPTFDGARDFPWINKPSSIQYFMEHARPELDRLGETVIAILDPDFIFIKPLTQTGLRSEDIIATRGADQDSGVNRPFADVVKKGRPVAQRYGLEGGWVNPKYDLTEITGDPNNKAQHWTYHEAAKYTSVGPPLMLHVDDITSLSVLWEKYMRPVLKMSKKDILADMWAYSIGSAQLDLKHTTLDQYMISTWGDHGEAFPWINEWEHMSCLDPQPAPGYKMPTFIHLASNFKAPDGHDGPWMFHKGHVPAGILDCDTPLIKESPDDLFEISKGAHNRQRAWVLCHTVSKLNKILLMYKEKFCPSSFERRKLVRLIQSKTQDKNCNEKRDKWCFPLAQIEDLPNNWRSAVSY